MAQWLRLSDLDVENGTASWEFYDPKQPSVVISAGSGTAEGVVSAAIEAARQARKSLRKAVEKALADHFSAGFVAPVVEEGEALTLDVASAPVIDHWHEEFELLGNETKRVGSETKERMDALSAQFAPLDHPHPWQQQLLDAISELTRGFNAQAKEIEGLRFDLKYHGHDVPDHPHAGTQAQIVALREVQAANQARLDALPPPPDLSTLANAQSVQKALIALRDGLTTAESDLSARIDAVANATPVLPPLLSREDVAEMIETAKPKAGKRTFVLLSQQEVAGKDRYVIEEV